MSERSNILILATEINRRLKSRHPAREFGRLPEIRLNHEKNRINYLFLFFLSGFYLFDQQLGLINKSNNIGTLLYILVTAIFFHEIFFSRTGAISKKIVLLISSITGISLLGFISTAGCTSPSRGMVSLLLIWVALRAIRIAPITQIIINRRVSNILLCFILFFLVLPAFGVNLFNSKGGSGVYFEPANLAVYVVPLIAYKLVASIRDFLGWAAVILVLLICPSSTFFIGLVGIFLLVIVRVKIFSSARSLFHAIVYIGLAIGTISLLDTSGLQERVAGILDTNGVDQTRNLSSLVWLNGWSQAYEYFTRTHGLGVGFNQMGCNNFENLGTYSNLMLATLGVVLNSQDGSFMASKLISELGFIGIFLVVFLTSISLKSIYQLSKLTNLKFSDPIILARAIGGICLLSLLFVRAGGYFQLPVILAISLLNSKPPIKNSTSRAFYA